MELIRRYPLAAALAILAALLAVVLAVEWASSASLRERVTRSGAPGASVQAKLLPPVAAVNPDQEYAETGSRPLFIPTRRPAPAQAQAAAASAMAKGQFTLTGVTIVGSNKIALLREKSSGRVVRVEQGKDVNGITVATIERDRVLLTQGGDQELVEMLVAKGSAQPAAAAAPVAAAAGPFAPPPPAPGAPPAPSANPMVRAAPPPGAQPNPQGQQPPVNPNTLFGPRPGGLTPVPGQPVPDPTTASPTTSAPLTPEELLARRRARRGQQSQ